MDSKNNEIEVSSIAKQAELDSNNVEIDRPNAFLVAENSLKSLLSQVSFQNPDLEVTGVTSGANYFNDKRAGLDPS